MKKYRCKICGYIYEGDELPSDYKCPLCGMGIEYFEEVVEDTLAINEAKELLSIKPETKKKKYRCKVCGYIYEGDELPSDYKCPLCGLGTEYFEEISEEEKVVTSELKAETIDKRIPIEEDNPAIARVMEKCINCGRCKTVCEDIVGIHYDYHKTKCAVCVHCGQCILNCPVGALIPKYQYKALEREIEDSSKIVVAFTSPSVRVALGEAFGMEAGSFVEGKMIQALREVGVDYVLDTTFGADLTIMEEASELIERIQKNETLPQFTSCCPAWVKYVEMYYPDLIKHLSTTKSPIGMQGTMVKTYFSKLKGIDPKNIVTVALAPCTAKKYEITRSQLCDSGIYHHDETIRDNDYVITTSEFALMLREKAIDFVNLPDSQYDDLFGRGSGAGLIFGNTGGVMEAAIRTAYYLITGNSPTDSLLHFQSVRGLDSVREASITIDDKSIKVAVIHGLPNVVPFLEQLRKGEKLEYSFIEVMNCRGGCIGGGGQPLSAINQADEIRKKRIAGLYREDEKNVIRCSHENPDIQKIYRDFLEHPLSSRAKELLHTSYEDKSKLLKEENSFDINNK